MLNTFIKKKRGTIILHYSWHFTYKKYFINILVKVISFKACDFLACEWMKNLFYSALMMD